jgi:DNA-binding transcriptional ArsR family regulator
VGELAREVPVTRPAVSQHLKVLKTAGLAFDRQVGTRRLYQVDPRGVEALRDYLDSFWGQALAAFQAHVEQEEHRADVPGVPRRDAADHESGARVA